MNQRCEFWDFKDVLRTKTDKALKYANWIAIRPRNHSQLKCIIAKLTKTQNLSFLFSSSFFFPSFLGGRIVDVKCPISLAPKGLKNTYPHLSPPPQIIEMNLGCSWNQDSKIKNAGNRSGRCRLQKMPCYHLCKIITVLNTNNISATFCIKLIWMKWQSQTSQWVLSSTALWSISLPILMLQLDVTNHENVNDR